MNPLNVDVNVLAAPPASLFGPDARVQRIVFGLGLLWVMSAADLYFTLWAHRWTPFADGNPIANQLLVQRAYNTVIFFKLVSVVVGSTIFWTLRTHRRSEHGLAFVLVCLLAICLCWVRYTKEAQATTGWMATTREHIEDPCPRESDDTLFVALDNK